MAGSSYKVFIGGREIQVSGTSASTPVVAGLFSLVNSQRLEIGKPPLGLVNPALYAGYDQFTNDITSGTNKCPSDSLACCSEGFFATPGWDPVTGIGSLDFTKMSTYLMNLVNGIPTIYTVTQMVSGVDKAQVTTAKFTEIYTQTIGSLLNINASYVNILSTYTINEINQANVASSKVKGLLPYFDLPTFHDRNLQTTQGVSIGFSITARLTNFTSIQFRLTKGVNILTSTLQLNGYPQAQAFLPLVGPFAPTPSPTQKPTSPPNSSRKRAAIINGLLALIGLLSMALSF